VQHPTVRWILQSGLGMLAKQLGVTASLAFVIVIDPAMANVHFQKPHSD